MNRMDNQNNVNFPTEGEVVLFGDNQDGPCEHRECHNFKIMMLKEKQTQPQSAGPPTGNPTAGSSFNPGRGSGGFGMQNEIIESLDKQMKAPSNQQSISTSGNMLGQNMGPPTMSEFEMPKFSMDSKMRPENRESGQMEYNMSANMKESGMSSWRGPSQGFGGNQNLNQMGGSQTPNIERYPMLANLPMPQSQNQQNNYKMQGNQGNQSQVSFGIYPGNRGNQMAQQNMFMPPNGGNQMARLSNSGYFDQQPQQNQQQQQQPPNFYLQQGNNGGMGGNGNNNIPTTSNMTMNFPNNAPNNNMNQMNFSTFMGFPNNGNGGNNQNMGGNQGRDQQSGQQQGGPGPIVQNPMNYKSSGTNSQEALQKMIFEAYVKEYQQKIMNLMKSQNQALAEIKEKNLLLQNSLGDLLNEMMGIRSMIRQANNNHALNNPLSHHMSAAATNQGQINSPNHEMPSRETLFNFLFRNRTFKYQLALTSEFPPILYRERNFKYSVSLIDLSGNKVVNSNKIPISIALYTSENTPKLIETNTSGNKILKGNIEKDLEKGTVVFDRLQIREVTSHFRNGWLFLVVFPKPGNKYSAGNASGTTTEGVVVDSNDIRPLILEKVIVKAKKYKELGGSLSGKDSSKKEKTENEVGEDDDQIYVQET